MDTRGCFCDGKNDKSRCGDDKLVRVRDCPATRDFELDHGDPRFAICGTDVTHLKKSKLGSLHVSTMDRL